MKALLRYYSLASLLCVVIAAALLTLGFRRIAIDAIIQLAEANNLALAESTMAPIRAILADYLDSVSGITPEEARSRPLPSEVDNAIADVMERERIARIKLHNRNGLVVFSTRADQTGGSEPGNIELASAIGGQVRAKLVFRDRFNRFGGATEDDNLVQSYLPVRHRPTGPVVGVFEMYVDVTPLVHAAENAEEEIAIGTLLIMMMLYGALMLVVQRIAVIIEEQQQTIRERTATLQALSAQMLRSEEQDRKRFASELHEGLAQTLSALKLAAEGASSTNGGKRGGASEPAVISALQAAIREVRTIAMDLRPPSLDELGLLPTLEALCREFATLHPEIDFERTFPESEATIPPPLKIVIYRTVELVLRAIAREGSAKRLRLALSHEHDEIILGIAEDSTADLDPARERNGYAVESRFAAVKERVILSGGEFLVSESASGGVRLSATWPARGAGTGDGRHRERG